MARALKFLSYVFARVFIFLSAGTERPVSPSCMVTQYLEMRPPFLGKSMAMAVNTSFHSSSRQGRGQEILFMFAQASLPLTW